MQVRSSNPQTMQCNLHVDRGLSSTDGCCEQVLVGGESLQGVWLTTIAEDVEEASLWDLWDIPL